MTEQFKKKTFLAGETKSMSPKKIALFYGHVASNIGDLAINEGEVRLLRNAFPEASLQVILLDAEKNEFLQSAKTSFGNDGSIVFRYFHAKFEDALIFQSQPQRFFNECGAVDADLIVLAAGEHLFAYSRPENTKSLFWRTLPALAAKACNKPCILLPSTFGPFEDRKSFELASAFLSLLDHFAARENYSARTLSASFDIDKPTVALDPAFFIEPPTLNRRGNLLPDDKKVLGLAMRSEGWGIRLSKEQRTKISDSFKENSYENSVAFKFSYALAKDFLQRDLTSVQIFIQTVADEELAHHLKEALSKLGHNERVDVVRPVSIQDYLARLANVDYVVATRFHAIILSLVVGSPVFGAYFDVHGHKLPGLFDLLGINTECVNLSITEPELAATLVARSITRQDDDYWPQVQSRIKDLKDYSLSWLSGHPAEKSEDKDILTAFGAFGEIAFSLARDGFEAEKKKEIQAVTKSKVAAEGKLTETQSLLKNARSEGAQLAAEVETLKSAHAGKIRSIAEEHKQALASVESKAQALETKYLDLNEQVVLLREWGGNDQAELAKAQEEARNERLQRVASEKELVRLQEQLKYQQALTDEHFQVRDRKIAYLNAALERSNRDAEELRVLLKERNETFVGGLEEIQRQPDAPHSTQQEPTAKSRQTLMFTGAEIVKCLATPPSDITFETIGKTLRVASTLGPGNHAYVYANEFLSLSELGFSNEIKFHLCTSLELDVQIVILFFNAKKERIGHVVDKANINQVATIPEGAVWIKWGLRFFEFGVVTIDEIRFDHLQLDLGEVFRAGGPESVIKDAVKRSGGNAKTIARDLLKLGKMLADEGHPEGEYPLALAATKYEQSEPVIRGFFWAAQRAKEFEAACGAILELEKIAGQSPSAKQIETLQKLKTSPAYLLSILKLIEPKHPPKLDSITRRICYVLHNSLPYSSGGYGTRSHGVAGGLKQAGYDVVILTRPGFPVDIKPELIPGQVPLTDDIDGIRYVRTLEPLRTGVSALEYMTTAADALEARIREYRPEVVIAASNHLTALPALIAARRLGLPFIYEVRGLWEITRMSRENEFAEKPAFAVQRILEASVAKNADHVFTLTEPMKEELVERGVASEKIELLPNSCDPSRFLPRERDEELAARLGIPSGVPVIGYIGTFVDYEGLEDLASACALIKEQNIQFRLLMVGNENASGQDRGPITEEIARIAEENAFSDWLIMTGRVPHEEVESYYSLIDIAPFPRKPWPVCEMVSPMKPLEALAMEKAVVVSSVRALVEMIDHEKTGLVFDKGNVESLSATLSRLIDSPELRKQLGIQGRRWVEQERTWRQIGIKAVKFIEPVGIAKFKASHI